MNKQLHQTENKSSLSKSLPKTAFVILLLTIFSSSFQLQISQRRSGSLEQELRSNKFANHQHIDINNTKKTVVTYGTHQFKPTNMFIWFKRVKTQGKKPLLYYKEKPYHSWKKAPKGCSVIEPKQNKQASQCAEGQKLGKALARTIAYMAILQGREMSKGLFPEKKNNRKKASQRSYSSENERLNSSNKAQSIDKLSNDEQLEKLAEYQGDVSKKLFEEEKELEKEKNNPKMSVRAHANYKPAKSIHTKIKSRKIDMEEVSDAIRNAVRKTASCLVKGFSTPDQSRSVKKVCLVRAMIKQSNTLIEDIIEGAVLHGFKCDYEALKMGKCRLSEVDNAVKEGDQFLKTINRIDAF